MNPSAQSFLEDALNQRLLFFTGKGGVGKSAIAWATALACAHRGKRVLFLDWNPYAVDSSGEGCAKGVDYLVLGAEACFKEYVLKTLRFESLYSAVFENHVLRTFVRVAPGLSDTVIAGKIWDLYQNGTQDILVVDLPSSGHTLSFFQSPMGVKKMFGVGFVHKEADKICQMLVASNVRLHFVSTPEELPLEESRQFKEKLTALAPFPFGWLIMNQILPTFSIPAVPPAALESLWKSYQLRKESEQEVCEKASVMGLPQLLVPRFSSEGMAETVAAVSAFFEKTVA